MSLGPVFGMSGALHGWRAAWGFRLMGLAWLVSSAALPGDLGRGKDGGGGGVGAGETVALVSASPMEGSVEDVVGASSLHQLREWHDAGVLGDKGAVRRAEEGLRLWVLRNPEDAVARVYWGSSLTLRGRDALLPTSRLGWVREGLREMDRAVELAAEDPEVRLARAINHSALPAFLGRRKVAGADWAWLWARVTAAEPQGLAAQPEFRRWVALHHGDWCLSTGEQDRAVEIWTQGLEWGEDSAWELRFQDRIGSVRKGGDGKKGGTRR